MGFLSCGRLCAVWLVSLAAPCAADGGHHAEIPLFGSMHFRVDKAYLATDTVEKLSTHRGVFEAMVKKKSGLDVQVVNVTELPHGYYFLLLRADNVQEGTEPQNGPQHDGLWSGTIQKDLEEVGYTIVVRGAKVIWAGATREPFAWTLRVRVQHAQEARVQMGRSILENVIAEHYSSQIVKVVSIAEVTSPREEADCSGLLDIRWRMAGHRPPADPLEFDFAQPRSSNHWKPALQKAFDAEGSDVKFDMARSFDKSRMWGSPQDDCISPGDNRNADGDLLGGMEMAFLPVAVSGLMYFMYLNLKGSKTWDDALKFSTPYECKGLI